MRKDLTGKVTKEMIFKKRIIPKNYDFSSQEAKDRIKKVLEEQKAIRKSTYYTLADLEKIYITI